MRRYLAIRKKEDDEDDEDIIVHHHTHHHHHPSSDVVSERSTEHHSHPVMAEVMARMHNYPSTWEGRMSSPEGHMSIVKMEYDELTAAHAMRDKHAVKKELEDLAAACICALKAMHS